MMAFDGGGGRGWMCSLRSPPSCVLRRIVDLEKKM